MCHHVETRKGFFGVYLGMLIGAKTFKYRRGKLSSMYISDPPFFYEFEKCDDGLKCNKSLIRPQAVNFDITIVMPGLAHSFLYPVVRKITAGAHVSPLGEGKKLSTEIMDLGTGAGTTLPVAFRKDKVVFYDGLAVSVAEFILLKPGILKDCIGGWKLSKEWYDEYKQIYENVEEKQCLS